ncbi:hypothetical protein BP00DRAFT_341358, partial [Aspergillus indologenus CBS 114.80]
TYRSLYPKNKITSERTKICIFINRQLNSANWQYIKYIRNVQKLKIKTACRRILYILKIYN